MFPHMELQVGGKYDVKITYKIINLANAFRLNV